jgi:hypothetical protein
MARVSTLLTQFPNGVGQFIGLAPGGAAGNLTVTGGVKAGDRILQAMYVLLSGVFIKTLTDLTSEFTATAANTINNTGGTSTQTGFVICQFATAIGNM